MNICFPSTSCSSSSSSSSSSVTTRVGASRSSRMKTCSSLTSSRRSGVGVHTLRKGMTATTTTTTLVAKPRPGPAQSQCNASSSRRTGTGFSNVSNQVICPRPSVLLSSVPANQNGYQVKSHAMQTSASASSSYSPQQTSRAIEWDYDYEVQLAANLWETSGATADQYLDGREKESTREPSRPTPK